MTRVTSLRGPVGDVAYLDHEKTPNECSVHVQACSYGCEGNFLDVSQQTFPPKGLWPKIDKTEPWDNDVRLCPVARPVNPLF